MTLDSGNLTLVRLVQLVTQTDEGEGRGIVRPSILKEPSLPPVEVFERALVRHVVGERAAVSSSVKGITKGLELLLTGRIPDL